jgi:hypothetical protein
VMRCFNSAFSVSNCFIYVSLPIKLLSDKNNVLLKFITVPKNWVNAYNLFIELRDRNYPGNYYTLTYDSQSNRLIGVYHHLGIGQNFDVFFIRR